MDRVIAVLDDSGYESVEQPREIAGIPFSFTAMLAARGSLDLIAVVDLAIDTDDELIRRRVEGLARALDLVRSRRSLTVVLVGPRRGGDLIRRIAHVARVLTVGSPGEQDEAELRDALAVRLPLEVTTESEEAADSWGAACQEILEKHRTEVEPILAAARSGKGAVQERLGELLAEPIDELYKEGAL